MADNEDFYDRVIAPDLARLSKECKSRGMSFVAVASYNHVGDFGHTVAIQPGSPLMIRMIHCLLQCADGESINIDMFLINVIKWARMGGHSSTILSQLGAPSTPEPPASFGKVN